MQTDDIITQVNQVLKDNYSDDVTPPIDVYGIAKNAGLTLVEIPFPVESNHISGFITKNNGADTLYVNSNEPENRRKFTVAHELGHWYLHKDELETNPNRSILFRIALGKLNTDPIEKEANIFAANLLVPMNLLEQYNKDGEDTQSLAKQFGVSQDVIGYRLQLLREKPDENTKTQANS